MHLSCLTSSRLAESNTCVAAAPPQSILLATKASGGNNQISGRALLGRCMFTRGGAGEQVETQQSKRGDIVGNMFFIK